MTVVDKRDRCEKLSFWKWYGEDRIWRVQSDEPAQRHQTQVCSSSLVFVRMQGWIQVPIDFSMLRISTFLRIPSSIFVGVSYHHPELEKLETSWTGDDVRIFDTPMQPVCSLKMDWPQISPSFCNGGLTSHQQSLPS